MEADFSPLRGALATLGEGAQRGDEPEASTKALHAAIVASIDHLGVAPCSFGLSCKGGLFLSGDPSLCRGRFELSMPHKGYLFSRGDVLVPGPSVQRFAGNKMLRIKMNLAGEGCISGFRDGSEINFAGSACILVDVADDEDIILKTPKDGRQCGLTLWLPKGLLTERWALSCSDLPSPFREVEQGKDRYATGLGLSLTPSLAAAVISVMQTQLSGALLDLFLEAKAREIVTLIISQMREAEGSQRRLRAALDSRDRAKITLCHQLVSSQFQKPLSISTLSKRIGLNRNKLCFGFKDVYGVSIFDYCRELRLQRGMTLLQETTIGVTEVALEVGYEHAPAFSTAFKRRFGCSPKDFRSRGVILP